MRLKDYGAECLEVSDNGGGIEPECFESLGGLHCDVVHEQCRLFMQHSLHTHAHTQTHTHTHTHTRTAYTHVHAHAHTNYTRTHKPRTHTHHTHTHTHTHTHHIHTHTHTACVHTVRTDGNGLRMDVHAYCSPPSMQIYCTCMRTNDNVQRYHSYGK